MKLICLILIFLVLKSLYKVNEEHEKMPWFLFIFGGILMFVFGILQCCFSILRKIFGLKEV